MKRIPHSLTELPNIGKVLAAQLERAGIGNVDDLTKAGSKKAFSRIRTIDPGACINLLYALEGAIEGTHWKHVPAYKRKELQSFFDHLNEKSHVGV
jgi:DNA transformation protein and related proteins